MALRPGLWRYTSDTYWYVVTTSGAVTDGWSQPKYALLDDNWNIKTIGKNKPVNRLVLPLELI